MNKFSFFSSELDESLSDGANWLLEILISVLDFISNNKLIFSFVAIPVVTTVLIIVIDNIFNIRDLFSDFKGFKNDNAGYIKSFNKVFKQHKKQKQKSVNVNDYYQKQRELADYKHSLKMQELNKFADNYDKVHPYNKTSFQYSNEYKKSADSVDTDVIKTFEYQKMERQHVMNEYYKAKNRENTPSRNKKYSTDLDIEVEDEYLSS